MVILRPVPVDIMQIGEQSAVDFFISRDGRLEPFLEKGEMISGGSPRDPSPRQGQQDILPCQ
jgi:hypothetical protein